MTNYQFWWPFSSHPANDERVDMATSEAMRQVALSHIDTAKAKLLAGDPDNNAIEDVWQADEILTERQALLEVVTQ